MRRTAAALIAGLVLGTAGVGTAATTGIGWSHRTNGIYCKTQEGGVACIPTAAHGYGVAIHRDYVLVLNLDTNKVVYRAFQP